ncbi:hypothetical protein BG262_08200 [Floricoccus penangensis]|uniref:DUF3021 domain-containing protein n=1 Tax=Floricoccus penangensis TaxID=1859475 RepID=A0A9Q5JHK6_9LACT|nr:DUF3021 domain-containing protein [Floricoccus penangensis]OFI47676.1 hypothetical protein BG262_08200 [Floricoccus penangensis]
MKKILKYGIMGMLMSSFGFLVGSLFYLDSSLDKKTVITVFIMGFIVGMVTTIFDITSLSYVTAIIIHFFVTLTIITISNFILGSGTFLLNHIFTYLAQFIFIYVIIWIGIYFFQRKDVDTINQQLKKRKK